MDSLRVILVILAVAVVAGIYGYTVWRRKEAEIDLEVARDDDKADLYDELDAWEVRRIDRGAQRDPADPPGPGGGDVDMGDLEGLRADPEDHEPRRRGPAPDPQPAPESAAAPAAGGTGAEQLIVALSLMAPAEEPYQGDRLMEAFDEVGLSFGDMDIFHHHGMDSTPSRTPLFSVASVVEPGTFDPGAMEGFSTPGLVMFMQLPGPVDGQVGLELMLNTGQRLKDMLGGELRDERRSVLTQQTIGHLRERIAEYNRRRLVPAG